MYVWNMLTFRNPGLEKLGDFQAGWETSPYAMLAQTDMVQGVHRTTVGDPSQAPCAGRDCTTQRPGGNVVRVNSHELPSRAVLSVRACKNWAPRPR